MLLQEFVPLSDSVSYHISQHSWRRGMSNFFIEKVPFSFSTSNEYAQFCIDLMRCFKQDSHPLSVLEVGSGLGLLAKKIISKYESEWPDQPIQFTLSEYSDAVTEGLKSLDFVHESPNVSCETCDITRPNFSKDYDLMLLTYIWDVLPCTILEFDNGNCYEWLVSASISDELIIQDTTSMPFKTLGAAQIKQLLNGTIPDQYLALLSRIAENIHYQWKRQPFDTSQAKYAGLLQELQKKSEKHQQSFFMNYSDSLLDSLDACIKQFQGDFVLLCHDFAHTRPLQGQSVEHTIGRFGLCQFYNIPFYLIKAFCENRGLQCITSQYKDSDNQIAIISSYTDETIVNNFKALLSKKEPGMNSYEVAQLYLNDDITTANESALTEDEKSDYYLLFCKAKHYFKREQYNDCLTCLDLLINDYGKAALSAFVLASKALRKLKFQKEALELLSQVDDTSYDAIALEKVFIYAEMADKAMMQESIESYFRKDLKSFIY